MAWKWSDIYVRTLNFGLDVCLIKVGQCSENVIIMSNCYFMNFSHTYAKLSYLLMYLPFSHWYHVKVLWSCPGIKLLTFNFILYCTSVIQFIYYIMICKQSCGWHFDVIILYIISCTGVFSIANSWGRSLLHIYSSNVEL